MYRGFISVSLGVLLAVAGASTAFADSIFYTFPFTGVSSENHVPLNNNSYFIQPIGSLDQTAYITRVQIDAVYDGSSSNPRIVLLKSFVTSSLSVETNSGDDTCTFYDNSEGSSVTSGSGGLKSGQIDFYPPSLIPCAINPDGFYALYVWTVGTESYEVHGTSGFTSLGTLKWSTDTGATSVIDTYISNMFWRLYAPGTTTDGVISLLNAATSTDEDFRRARDDVASSESCHQNEDGSIVTEGLCKMLFYLFMPPTQSLNQFTFFWETVQNKPPFGYFGAMSVAWHGLSSTTAPVSTTPSLTNAMLGASVVYGSFFDDWKENLGMVLYLLLAIYIFSRLIYLEFHH